jgi:hypothetical protein
VKAAKRCTAGLFTQQSLTSIVIPMSFLWKQVSLI